jgi:parallel beta-helix repeat protein
MNFTPIFLGAESQIIYVDDDNTQGPWEGTSQLPYQYIQDGINAAIEGDIVYVYNGTYYENVEINESIELIGENKHSTVIDGIGGDSTIKISARNINLTGFTLKNATEGLRIRQGYNDISVRDNIISNNSYSWAFGIYVKQSSGHIITNNFIVNNTNGLEGKGIVFERVSNSIVSNNSICSNGEVGVQFERASGNKLIGNTISGNGRWGVYVHFNSDYNTINDNTISNNDDEGIFLYGSDTNTINYNIINNNGRRGIYGKVTFNIQMYANNITNNGGDGISFQDRTSHIWVMNNNISSNANNGVILLSDDYNIIHGNNILYNNKDGIYLFGNNNDYNNFISANNVYSNGFDGIHLRSVCHSTVYRNTLAYNTYGITIFEQASIDTNTIYHNRFINNIEENAFDQGINTWSNLVCLEGNYWSDFDEPNEGAWDNNSDGIVDTPYLISGGNNSDSYPLISPSAWHNTPPVIPAKPSGPKRGETFKHYAYSTIIIDPEEYPLYYNFSWGDGTYSGWLGPLPSGQIITMTHTWKQPGTYHVKVKIKDIDYESDWSEPQSVRIFRFFKPVLMQEQFEP